MTYRMTQRAGPGRASGGRSGAPARALVVGMIVLMIVALAPAGHAYPRPGRTERVSVATDGREGNAPSMYPSISGDGRYIAFASWASSLVPGDTNLVSDVFVRDRQTGVTERVSVAQGGAEANGASARSAIDGNGRYVTFESDATNLIPGDTNGTTDIFVHDRQTGSIERVSVRSGGVQVSGYSRRPSITPDGRYVTFESDAPNLVPGDTNATRDAFIHDRQTGVTERVSVGAAGAQGDGTSQSSAGSMSTDGRYVVFQSTATNLVPGDTNGAWDAFLRDRETGTTERVSLASDGSEGTGGSLHPRVSADGRYVAFWSRAPNLIAGDTNWNPLHSPAEIDVFVRDREEATTERVSVASDGTQATQSSYLWMSADARYIAFESTAPLVDGDTQLPQIGDDVFVRDRETGTTERVSVATDGAQGDLYASQAAMSADGRHVAFVSWSTNIVPGDHNEEPDVFVRDRGPSLGVGDMSVVAEGGTVSVAGWARLAGTVVASATDGAADALPGGAPAGAELTGASLVYRPEEADLLARLDLTSLPGVWGSQCHFSMVCHDVSSGAGVPAVMYGVEFDLAGVTYQLRAARVAATAVPAATPHFALYRCEATCEEQTRVSGSVGTTGAHVMISLPAAALGGLQGASFAAVRAFTALGEAATGGPATFDEVALPESTIPVEGVSVGIAPAGTPEAEVAFDTAATLTDGRFSADVDASSLVAGDYDVWARGCVGERCGSLATRIALG